MEWLPVAARKQSLLGRSLLNRTRPFLSSQTSRPHYAFPPSSRRINSRERTTEADIDGNEEPRQAYPLSGYYHDILVTKSPYHRQAPTSRPVPTKPEKSTPASTVEPQSPKDKMSIVFGSRLQTPGRSSRYAAGNVPPESMWKTINGVAIPPRPSEPDKCCMSG